MERIVYILQDRNGSLYIGATSNLERRLKEHREALVYTTKRNYIYRSLVCIHFYLAPDFFKADKLERYLHTLTKEDTLDIIKDVPFYCDWLQNEILSSNLPKILVSLPNKSQMGYCHA